MKKPKRILIVRPDRVGDVVLSTPLPREIKKTFPDSFIAVLLKKYTAEIYHHNPYVDKVILIDDSDDGSIKAFIKKVKEIRKYKFTHSLTLLPTERINYMLFFAGIPYRVGVSHKFYQFITFTRYVSRNKYIPLRHEADYCMDLARKIGVQSDNFNTELFLSDDEKVQVGKRRKELLEERKYLVGIHITSGNSAPNWKQHQYEKLIEELSKREEIQVVITENTEISELKKYDVKFIDSGLRNLIISVAALDMLISSSTGPMHIAAALKVKTISLFCPLTASSPKLWGPMGNENIIIMPSEQYCSKVCPGNPKICSFEGDGGIEPERVYKSVLSALKIS